MIEIKAFSTEKKARKWAEGFTYARACNDQPPLVVKPIADDQWGVFLPEPNPPAKPFRIPGSDPNAPTQTDPAQATLPGT